MKTSKAARYVHQYKKDLRPEKFTNFLRSKYKNNFPDENMFYAMATENGEGMY